MRRRILFATLVVATVAVVVFGVPLALVMRGQYRDQARLQLERQTIQAARDIGMGALDGSDPAELPAITGLSFGLYRSDGTLIGGTGPEHGDPVVSAAGANVVADANTGSTLRVAVPLVADARVVGVLRAEQSTKAVETRTRRAWLLTAALAIAAIGLAGLVAWWLTRRLTRPLEQVRDAAVRLGDGDFSITVSRSGVAELDVVGEALTSTAERLGRQLTRERSFSADASHQLRTPLTGLRLILETELDAPRDDRSAALTEALAEADRLAQTVDGLLALSRREPLDRQPLDVAALIGEAQQRWHGPLTRAGRVLRVAIVGDLPAPDVSQAAVATVLDVLLDNALRHGAGEVLISARSVTGARGRFPHPGEGGIVIAVSDQGVGVEADLELVFVGRRSNRGETAMMRASGHGIGLPLARSLAEAEGGRLVLGRSTPSPTFELILPT